MTTTPRVLIDSSIHQLEALSAALTDELGEWRARSHTRTVEARACKEILLTISVLIPKLQAALYVVGENETGPVRRCEDCEDRD